MVYHRFDIVYGVLVQWGELKKTKLVPTEMHDRDAGDFILRTKTLNELDLICVDVHEIAEDYERSNPSRLPPSYLNSSKDEDTYPELIDENDDLICIGVKVGTIVVRMTHEEDIGHYPSFEEIATAKTTFDGKVPSELLAISGQPNLHFIPDDCGCCS